MKKWSKTALVLIFLFLVAEPVKADIETARQLMEQNKFAEARELLLPAAQTGSAVAEELIGIMYAMGLGVPRDSERAFDWYLRSALKGRPSAQSGLGWYYEVGLGIPAPDLVRAYAWYELSGIGGDPDAAANQQKIISKMSAEQVAKAKLLITDYREFLYLPLR